MKKMIMTWLCVSLFSFCSCQKDLIEYEAGDIKVCIEEGDEWLHDFPLFLGIKKKNPPQIVIWMEDMYGNQLFMPVIKLPRSPGKVREVIGEKRHFHIGVIHAG